MKRHDFGRRRDAWWRAINWHRVGPVAFTVLFWFLVAAAITRLIVHQ